MQLLWKTVGQSLKKLKHILLSTDPAIPLLARYSKELKNRYANKNLYFNVHSSTIHNNQQVERTQISTDENKMWYVHSMEYYLAIKEWSVDTQYNMTEPQTLCFIKEVRHILYDAIYRSRWIHRDKSTLGLAREQWGRKDCLMDMRFSSGEMKKVGIRYRWQLYNIVNVLNTTKFVHIKIDNFKLHEFYLILKGFWSH